MISTQVYILIEERERKGEIKTQSKAREREGKKVKLSLCVTN
jgi:hypothetical protein